MSESDRRLAKRAMYRLLREGNPPRYVAACTGIGIAAVKRARAGMRRVDRPLAPERNDIQRWILDLLANGPASAQGICDIVVDNICQLQCEHLIEWVPGEDPDGDPFQRDLELSGGAS